MTLVFHGLAFDIILNQNHLIQTAIPTLSRDIGFCFLMKPGGLKAGIELIRSQALTSNTVEISSENFSFVNRLMETSGQGSKRTSKLKNISTKDLVLGSPQESSKKTKKNLSSPFK